MVGELQPVQTVMIKPIILLGKIYLIHKNKFHFHIQIIFTHSKGGLITARCARYFDRSQSCKAWLKGQISSQMKSQDQKSLVRIEKKWLMPRQFKNCVRWVLSDSVLDENFDFENSILDVRPDSVHVCQAKNTIIDCLDSKPQTLLLISLIKLNLLSTLFILKFCNIRDIQRKKILSFDVPNYELIQYVKYSYIL